MAKTFSAKFGDEVRIRVWDWNPDLVEGEEVIPESVAFSVRGPESFATEHVSTVDGYTTFKVSGGGMIGALATINLIAMTTAGQTIGAQAIQPIKSR